ncbi:MAG: hypothetical protein JWR69_3335 [Pedosphaera sp.]|nr:hypothetical protein [Pedosphaera sp.]
MIAMAITGRRGLHSTIVRRGVPPEYLTGEGAWAPDSDQALLFVSTLAALEYCMKQKITEGEIVMLMSDPCYDVVMSLGKGLNSEGFPPSALTSPRTERRL